jgi:hypothetical protein
VSEHNIVFWKLENKGKFSVKSTYNALTYSKGVHLSKISRRGRFLQKLRFFFG